MRIAFCGWAGDGKTEAAKYLEFTKGYKRVSFADGIKDIACNVFNMKGKRRKLLQSIGEKMREIDGRVWINHTINRLDDLHDWVIDDLRRRNEFEELIKNDFVVVRIVASEDKRIERLKRRDGFCDESLLYNESERGTEDLVLIQIENNGTLEELHNKIDNLIVELESEGRL